MELVFQAGHYNILRKTMRCVMVDIRLKMTVC